MHCAKVITKAIQYVMYASARRVLDSIKGLCVNHVSQKYNTKVPYCTVLIVNGMYNTIDCKKSTSILRN